MNGVNQAIIKTVEEIGQNIRDGLTTKEEGKQRVKEEGKQRVEGIIQLYKNIDPSNKTIIYCINDQWKKIKNNL